MSIKNLFLAGWVSLLFFACVNDDEHHHDEAVEGGSFLLDFSHFVGSNELKMVAPGSTVYPYATADNQEFNITLFGYYLTQIRLIGDTVAYEDQVTSSINADEVKGFYHVLESDKSSKSIIFKNVPAGKYTHIEFTVGIPEEVVAEGAQGGILDLSNGAWFWGWNSGYISMKIEGHSPQSVSLDENDAPDYGLVFHIGGWRDVVPPTGEMQKLVNNIKTIRLELTDPAVVTENLQPQIHIVVDILKIINGAGFDFSKVYRLHNPAMGTPMADAFENAFVVDHVHAH